MRGANKTKALCLLAGLGVALASLPIAADQGRYWRDAQGNLWRNGSDECVRTGAWTPKGYTPGCDPEPPKAQPGQSEPGSPAGGAGETIHVAALETPTESTEPQPIELDTVTLFDLDSARIRPEGVKALNAIAVDAERAAKLDAVEVVGHADSTGPEGYNHRLSERRALSVKEQLVSAGIDPALIRTEGRGETDPIATNATAEGRQQNRRVVVRIRGAGKE
ncbi:MAG: OmpA family protein [Gammaproteobacteria bacterium]|nr:OmpA family protein [Gammaproteobacteria bacterium]NIR83704.1 OmpA family protein [Gammaproteobacteria bacterium]NIR91851.1 OmpA family protein [Gammaproteobacteria bacterium]NIU04870.1 OmpA family protein [Gammaproteobacteria bacterium]NIV51852.1 OmpA family protein [Gammaproteobacteria bacterium]